MNAKSKKQKKYDDQDSTLTASGGYQTPLEQDIRKTGDAEKVMPGKLLHRKY
jgi:hypothetical protein